MLLDTTLRSIIFGKRDYTMVKGPDGEIISEQVSKEQFDLYDHVLKIMAQLSRIVYCDTGILYKVIMDDSFATPDNTRVNDRITALDNEYSNLRKTPSSYENSINGRPMMSYIITESTGNVSPFARYISSPSDFTCLFLQGNVVHPKCRFFLPSDLIIAFKGSSTMKNFKHDLYSQFTPIDLQKVMPEDIKMSSNTSVNNVVPESFIKPILKNWILLKQQIINHKPSRIFITGHSLGGAFASLFTFLLCEIKQNLFPFIQSIHNITFGAPTILSDGARNTFNKHLDSGLVTLDRIVSQASFSKIHDIIPSIPVGFSHPGFQPLKTEFYPEFKTGRAYTYETVRKVFQQTGGGFFQTQKSIYEEATKNHIPTKVLIPAYSKAVQGFPHAEYFNMTFLGALRVYGMKNPGFKSSDGKYYIFLADLFQDGVKFQYISSPESTIAEEPQEQTITIPSTPTQGGNRMSKKRRRIRRKTYKNNNTSYT